MRKLLSLLLLLSSLAPCQAAEKVHPQEEPKHITTHEELAAATLALYSRYPTGKASKPFQTDFRCTATVVAGEPGQYVLLTAGHCFDDERPGTQFYVSENISDEPVLQSIQVIRKANTKRYDYALLMLVSPRAYPVIPVNVDGPLPAIESPVVDVNFGLALTKQIVKGYVGSGIITREEQDGGVSGTAGRFMVEFGIAPGASGSAVVDEKTGKIVGLVEAIFMGLSNGTVVMPLGKNFDDFLVDGSLDQKPLPPSIGAARAVNHSAGRQADTAVLLVLLALLLVVLVFMRWKF